MLRGAVDSQLSVNNLAANSLTTIAGTTAPQRTLVMSLDLAVRAANGVSTEGVRVGVAHSDYSDAEIEEWIENAGGWDEGNLVSQEIMKRKIRDLGSINNLSNGRLHDGAVKRTKLNWVLTEGDALDYFAYNTEDVALGANGVIWFEGSAWLRPL